MNTDIGRPSTPCRHPFQLPRSSSVTFYSDCPSGARRLEHQVGRFLSLFEERLARQA
jgi:hypothetical protein